jgi:hypothetical protein
MWAYSFLSAHVFYGFLWLSTCNAIASGISPKSSGPRTAYFAAVLVFFLHSLCCILDTVETFKIVNTVFTSPTNSSTCTLAKTQQLFFFSGSQFYLAQAGATLGYMIIQLVIAGANILDSPDSSTLWAGSSMGTGLTLLFCTRLIIMFDGVAKGLSGKSQYVQLFSLPVFEYTLLFTVFMFFAGIMLGLEGVMLPGLAWRKSVRFVTFSGSFLFILFAVYALMTKALFTPGLLGLTCIVLGFAVFGLIEAIAAKDRAEIPPQPAGQNRLPPQAPQYPQYQQWGAWQGPVFQPYGQTGKQAAVGSRSRLYIPTPVEMIGEKNKGI